jgi:hypothetical protein
MTKFSVFWVIRISKFCSAGQQSCCGLLLLLPPLRVVGKPREVAPNKVEDKGLRVLGLNSTIAFSMIRNFD